MTKKRSYSFSGMMIVLFLLLVSLICLYPFLNAIAISLSGKGYAASGTIRILPKAFTFNSYSLILKDTKFLRALMISIERVMLNGVLTFIVTLLTAYPLSFDNKKLSGRNVIMGIFVFCMMFNGGLIPWYITISKLGILDTIWALVLPSTLSIGNVILLMNFFRNVPKDITEASIIDGAGDWIILRKIYLPLSLPALATVTLFSLVGIWNEFFNGMILMNSNNYPLQTYIQQLVVSVSKIRTASAQELKMLSEVSNQSLNMAKIVISMIPILLLYPFLQKYFTTGMVIGAVKG